MPIQRRAQVKWTAPGGGLRDYSGEVVCYVPAGKGIVADCIWERAGLPLDDLALAQNFADESKRPRYLIRCEESAEQGRHSDKPARTVYRTALASVVEKQNPDAPREGT